ncbi:MAG: hypothetical protein JKY33_03590 [Bacteroidia bacterium]|nr:hypothetical protein [Bacteroidia bacterium]
MNSNITGKELINGIRDLFMDKIIFKEDSLDELVRIRDNYEQPFLQ